MDTGPDPEDVDEDRVVPAQPEQAPELPSAPPVSIQRPAARPFLARARGWALQLYAFCFLARPTFGAAFLRFSLLAMVLYSRFPTTNYIFDEQEALLANPYVNGVGGLEFVDAIHRDFWGLAPDRSVGSYRPIPNFLWRSLWHISKAPFFHHFYNLVFHALTAALLTMVVRRLTRRADLAWFSGLIFVTAAVLTEAVSGIVGIADVLGGLGAVLALGALLLPGWAMPFGVFLALLFGLFSKESALVCVPLVPYAALVLATLTHPERPRAWLRMALAAVGAVAAFVLYVELRKVWFPSPLPSELTTPLPDDAGRLQVLAREFLVWFHQASLPKDPLNNPLVDATPDLRLAGALRVYARGLGQVVFPYTLSGDYSYPQEPVPGTLYFPGSILGAFFTVFPLVLAPIFWIAALLKGRSTEPPVQEPSTLDRRIRLVVGLFGLGVALSAIGLEFFWARPAGRSLFVLGVPWYVLVLPIAVLGVGLLTDLGARRVPPEAADEPVPLSTAALLLTAVGAVWVVVSYFPHSNIPILLPTVRAERFWYFPVLGSSLVLASIFSALRERVQAPGYRQAVTAFIVLFIGFQSVQAYRHAMDYRDDLAFWGATKEAVPNSAKAHLNYSVMVGARGDLQTRFEESRRAIELAPDWPMAHIYTADTLCRMGRVQEAWPYYFDGFERGPNEPSLIALALQCLYDNNALKEHEDALRTLSEQHKGSWLAYLAIDTLDNGAKYAGVDPKYRPRGYNEGPKDEGAETASASATGSEGDAEQPTAEPEEGPSASALPSGSSREL